MARSFQKPLPEAVPGTNPVNPVPPVVLALVLVIAGIEAVVSLGGQGLVGGPGAGRRLTAGGRAGLGTAGRRQSSFNSGL